MERYNINAPSNSQYEEAADGEWVSYEDANAWWNEMKELPRVQDVAEIHDLKQRLATARLHVQALLNERAKDTHVSRAAAAFLANQPAAPSTDLDEVAFELIELARARNCVLTSYVLQRSDWSETLAGELS